MSEKRRGFKARLQADKDKILASLRPPDTPQLSNTPALNQDLGEYDLSLVDETTAKIHVAAQVAQTAAAGSTDAKREVYNLFITGQMPDVVLHKLNPRDYQKEYPAVAEGIIAARERIAKAEDQSDLPKAG